MRFLLGRESKRAYFGDCPDEEVKNRDIAVPHDLDELVSNKRLTEGIDVHECVVGFTYGSIRQAVQKRDATGRAVDHLRRRMDRSAVEDLLRCKPVDP
jgi:hypothetical protein